MAYEALLFTAFVLGALLPFSLLIGREKIREKRYEVIADLESILFKTPRGATSIPSFELVKYKYRPHTYDERRGMPTGNARFIVPVGIYATVSAVGLVFAVHYFWLIFKSASVPAPVPAQLDIILCLMFTLVGGYVWSLQYLIRKVANFDLSPISFYHSVVHILLGMAISAVLGLSGFLGFLSKGLSLPGAGIAVALLIGFVPSMFMEYLTEQFPKLRLKRVSASSKALQDELPLDLICGIDPFIKFRLEEFEIVDVQNLATKNPIQIFVETPYGLYEVIDWVAQAQLILAVGSRKTLALRKYNVRTVFDLKKMTVTPALRKTLFSILSDSGASDHAGGAGGYWGDLSDKDIKESLDALVKIVVDDLHVRRLKQIWKIIDEAIDSSDGPTMICACGKLVSMSELESARKGRVANSPLVDTEDHAISDIDGSDVAERGTEAANDTDPKPPAADGGETPPVSAPSSA